MNILSLSKKESLVILLIFTFLITVTSLNIRVSLRKARDQERKNDIRAIYDALMKYNDEFGFFPASTDDGRIIACKGEINEFGFPNFAPCEYGNDSIRDIFDDSYPAYLEILPKDPHHDQGVQYYYQSTGKNFQIYAALESSNQDEYDQVIYDRALTCGSQICNFGRSNGQTPLDKSLQEYENELLDEK